MSKPDANTPNMRQWAELAAGAVTGSARAEHRGNAAPERPADGACPECGGRGWKVFSDGGAGRAVRCDCAKRQRGALYLAQAGIPKRYRSCRLGNFDTRARGNPGIAQMLMKAKKDSQRYVESFLDPTTGRFRESGLIYCGTPGSGKTHLAVAVLIEIIERYGARGRFIDFTALLSQIQSTFDAGSAESKKAILDPILGAEILVFDELGAQKPSDWLTDMLYLIVNSRYTQQLPTIFTTNYSLYPSTRATAPGKPAGDPFSYGAAAEAHRQQKTDSLAVSTPDNPFRLLDTRISPLLVSRIHEMATPIALSGTDYRKEHSPRI